VCRGAAGGKTSGLSLFKALIVESAGVSEDWVLEEEEEEEEDTTTDGQMKKTQIIAKNKNRTSWLIRRASVLC
jgi:hypothetical protein